MSRKGISPNPTAKIAISFHTRMQIRENIFDSACFPRIFRNFEAVRSCRACAKGLCRSADAGGKARKPCAKPLE